MTRVWQNSESGKERAIWILHVACAMCIHYDDLPIGDCGEWCSYVKWEFDEARFTE